MLLLEISANTFTPVHVLRNTAWLEVIGMFNAMKLRQTLIEDGKKKSKKNR